MVKSRVTCRLELPGRRWVRAQSLLVWARRMFCILYIRSLRFSVGSCLHIISFSLGLCLRPGIGLHFALSASPLAFVLALASAIDFASTIALVSASALALALACV